MRIMLKDNYTSYENALQVIGLDTLEARRKHLCLTIAKRCLKHEKIVDMLPVNPSYDPRIRQSEKYHVKFAKTSRLKNSSIPYLQRLLNDDYLQNK